MELVRKQIYITPAQDSAVKLLAQQLISFLFAGVTSAFIVCYNLREVQYVCTRKGGFYANSRGKTFCTRANRGCLK